MVFAQVAIATFFAIYFIVVVVKFLKFKKRFKKLPNTKIYPYIGNTKGTNSDPLTLFLQIHLGLAKLFEKEGLAVAWILTKPIVFLFTAKTVEALLTSTKVLEKSFEYGSLRPWLGTGLLTSHTDKWKNRRKMLTPSFHFRILDQFQPIINEHLNVTMSIFEKAGDTTNMDILEVLSLMTLDVVGETSLGKSFNAQADAESEYLRALKTAAKYFYLRISNLWLSIDFIYFLTADGKDFKKSVAIMQAVTRKAIQERKATFKQTIEDVDNVDDGKVKKRLALMDLLLEKHIENPSIFTLDEIREEIDTFLFAGHDTTSANIMWTLYLLGRHPDIQAKVVEELLSILPDGEDRDITQDDLKATKYLDCVIKESTRIYTPAPMIGRLATEDLNIDGHIIPKGAECWIPIYVIHKDPKIFPNPESFDPDRFTLENSLGRSPFAFIPFSAGPRNCIGQRFASMTVKTSLIRLINYFHIESLDPSDKIRVKTEMIMKPADKVRIRLTKRGKSDSL